MNNMMRYCARAPVRVDPAGGGTDAPPFSVEYGGSAVNISVARHAFASVDLLPPGSGVHIYSRDLQEGVSAGSVADLANSDAVEFLSAFVMRLAPDDASLLLVTESDIPAGSGLGGSGAIGVAVTAALDSALGINRPAADIAQVANSVERDNLGYAGGDQDSFGAAMGGFNLLSYPRGGGATAHRHLDVDDNTRLAIEENSLLMYTGEAHLSGSIHEDIRHSYTLQNSPTIEAMTQLREQAQKMARALECGDLEGYANALNASCENLYRLHENCDCPAHRELCGELSDLILARKTCGAGGGGFMLVYTRPGRRRECRAIAEATGATVWPFTVDTHGVRKYTQGLSSKGEIKRIQDWIASP
jgi:D-glycero-alpha-D-manno-heptose-7-phosphate kinase